jgi:hypothetical protein
MKRIAVYLLAALSCAAALEATAQAATCPPTPVEPLPGKAGDPRPCFCFGDFNRSMAGRGGYVLDDKHKLLAGDRVSFQIIQDRTNAIPLQVAESLS